MKPNRPDWRAPSATRILPASAPRHEWLAMRQRGLGGSDLAILMGTSTYESATVYNLWLEKTEQRDSELTSHQIRHGSDIEPILAGWFSEDTGVAVRKAGMHKSKENPVWFANPDRLTADGGVLEIKTTSRFTPNGKAWLTGEFPLDAYVQSQWYLSVLGRSHVWLAAEVDNSDFFIVGPLERDEDLISSMRERAEWFWGFVESKTPPPVDMATVTPDEVAARHPHVLDPDSTVEADLPELVTDDLTELAALKQQEKQVKEARTAIETRLKAQVGDAEYLTVEGRPVIRWQEVAGRRSFDKTAAVRKIAADRGLEGTPQELKTIEDEFMKAAAPTRRLTIIDKETAA